VEAETESPFIEKSEVFSFTRKQKFKYTITPEKASQLEGAIPVVLEDLNYVRLKSWTHQIEGVVFLFQTFSFIISLQ